MPDQPGKRFTIALRPDGVRMVPTRNGTNWRLWSVVATLLVICAAAAWYLSNPRSPQSRSDEVHNSHTVVSQPLRSRVEPPRPASAPAIRVRLNPKSSIEHGLQAGRHDSPTDKPHTAEEPNGSPNTGATSASHDEPSGIALFPPPGTNPPKSGLIVPDNFELPPGYARHYQVTDDGKPLPPILIFHPDAELFDASGNRIPLPPDLVVPPELAPPGLPLEVLQVPDTAVPFVEVPNESARPGVDAAE